MKPLNEMTNADRYNANRDIYTKVTREQVVKTLSRNEMWALVAGEFPEFRTFGDLLDITGDENIYNVLLLLSLEILNR